MAARVESQAGGTDDGAAPSIPSAFKNHLMLGATEAIMWIACRRHFSHKTIREHLERRDRNLRRRTGSEENPRLQVSPALSNRVDKATLQLFRLIIGGVPATGTLDCEGDPDHQKRIPVLVEFLKDGAYIELLSGHIRADPLLEKHSGYQRPTYLDVSIDRDAFFKALAAAEPRSQATDDEPIELADAPAPQRGDGGKRIKKPRGRGGRKPGSGSYAAKDCVLWIEMKGVMDRGEATTTWGAAKHFAERAPGATFDSKRRRLVKGYNDWIITQ